jgi:hypothetical protein
MAVEIILTTNANTWFLDVLKGTIDWKDLNKNYPKVQERIQLYDLISRSWPVAIAMS